MSKEQKKILEVVLTNTTNKHDGKANIRAVSYFVAKELNKGDGDRIKFVSKEAQERQRKEEEEKQQRIEEELKEQAAQSDETAKQALAIRHSFGGKKKRKTWLEDKHTLTSKHRASFSRSVKRLEDRGLIKKGFYPYQHIELTDKGVNAIDYLQSNREL